MIGQSLNNLGSVFMQNNVQCWSQCELVDIYFAETKVFADH